MIRIDRKKEAVKTSTGRPSTGRVSGIERVPGRGAGEVRVDRFERLGRVVGGSEPSSIISVSGPGQRVMMPLTSWEKYDIDHDPLFREAAARMRAYRNLPEPWKRKVDEWGRKLNNEMKYTIAKVIMKGA